MDRILRPQARDERHALPSFPRYGPHPLLRNGHLMTLALRLPRRRLRHVAPGAGLRVFRPDSESSFHAYCNWQSEPRRAPTLVLLHGIVGHGDAYYMLGTADKAFAAGFNTVRMTFRNCGETGPSARELGHSGFTDDLHFLLRELVETDGLERIYCAGFSLGGNLMFKMAGELGADAPAALRAVVGISPALDLAACAHSIDALRTNRLYLQHFLALLKVKARRMAAAYPDRYDLAGLDAVTRLQQFDEVFTAPHTGFSSAAEYYELASALPFVPSIRVPMLVIQSRDDPLIPFHFFERPELRANALVTLLVTARGGHCSFIGWRPQAAGDFRDHDRYWAENRILQFLLMLEAHDTAAA